MAARSAQNFNMFRPATLGLGANNSPDFSWDIPMAGAVFMLNLTAVSGTSPTLNVKIQRKDTAAGVYQDVVAGAFAEETGAAVATLMIYPGGTSDAPEPLGKVFRAVATIGGTATPTVTFSLLASPVP